MKQIFTRFIIFLLLTTSGYTAMAQSILEITEPAEAAGTFDLGNSVFFKGCLEGGVMGEMVNAEDGTGSPSLICSPVTNDISGKIAVIDRGDCSFKTKALNAQDAGAIAVLICNNLDASVDGGGILTLADDENITTDIIIPTVFASKEDCAVFRSSLPITGTITIAERVQNVIWGDQAGQGDFSGGINDWSSVTVECNGEESEYAVWRWNADATANDGSFSTGSLTSPSSCNGAMVFNSDFLDNNGDATTGGADDPAIGAGPCPAPQIGELISPVIDISAADVAGVSLSFYQAGQQFLSSFIVGYSIDGGTTWTDIPVNTDLETFNRVPNDEVFQLIPLPGAAGTSNLRIRFRMEGDYYFWIIDDVKIVEAFRNELIVTDFFYTPASAVQPASQIKFDPFYFNASVSNEGTSDQTNVKFIAEIVEPVVDGDGNLTEIIPIYRDSAIYEVIPSGVDTILEIETLWNPDVEPGAYWIVYNIEQSEEDENTENNVEIATFAVSENVYAKDLDGGNDITRNGGMSHSYANIYGIGADTKEDIVLSNVFFRSFMQETDGVLDGRSVNAYLMRISDEVDEFLSNLNIEATDITFDGQTEFVGFTEYVYPAGAGQGSDYFEAELEDFDTGGSAIPLEPGKRYMTVIEYPEESGVIFQVYSTGIDYSFRSSFLLYDRWFTGFQGQNGFAPIIGMELAISTSADDIPLPTGSMTLFPNPATDYVQAQFDFEEQLDATVTLATIDGKIIEYKNLPLLKDLVSFNTTNLAEGMYLLRVATDIGTKTEKFLVKRP